MNYSFSDPSYGFNQYNTWVPQRCFPGAGDLNRRLARPTEYTVQSNVCAPEPRGGIGILGVFATLAAVAVAANFIRNRRPTEEITIIKHTKKSVATVPTPAAPAVTDPKGKNPIKPIAPKSTTTSKNGAIVEEYDGYTVLKKTPTSVSIVIDTKDAAGATAATFDSDPSNAFVINGPLHHYKKNEAGDVVKQGTTGGYIEKGIQMTKFIDPATEKGSNFAKYNGIMGQDAGGNFFQITYDEWNKNQTLTAGARWAFQNGCILLDKDASGKAADPDYTGYGDTPEIRSAMGYDTAGQLIAITTTKKVTITQLQQMMRNAGAVEAMTLDGASVSGHIVDGTVTGTLLDNRPMFRVE
ncbi:MAG: phosphodiester glycosidase family protein [Vampirovibrionales bacterium]|nr:phosphodiester glycosidase family protein [Vampirovibrionales bacterium]